MDTLNKVISRNRTTSYFLYAIATLFTGILSWGFIMSIQQGLSAKEAIVSMPTQLEVMWSAVMGMIFGGHEEDVNKMERSLGIDLDKDGDIGLPGNPNSPAVPAKITPTEPEGLIAQIPAPEVPATPIATSLLLYGPPQ